MGGRSGRRWWVATGITLIVWALELFSGVNEIAWIAAVVVVLVALGLGTIVAALLPAGPATPLGTWQWTPMGRLQSWWRESGRARVALLGPWVIAVAVVAAFVIWSFLQVRIQPSYSTDEVAFDQYAATLALHGQNPYAHSMLPAFDMYQLSPNGATFHLNGSEVTSLSYPALSFELYLPFLALGWSSQLAVALNVVSWAVAMILLFGMLPKSIRASSLVILSLSTYAGYAVGGVTDALYVPFLLGAAFFWDRAALGRSRAWVSPLLFGLAMAVKQTPWFILPFVVVGVAAEFRSRHGHWGIRPAGRYLAIAMGVFLLPNLPYLISSPHQWVSGVMTPLVSRTVPAGQGLIGLSLFLHIGGGSLLAYSVTAAVAFLALLALYLASYPLLRGWTFVVPSLVLFFATRSFGSYLVMLVPIAYLAVARTFFGNDPGAESVALPSTAPTGDQLVASPSRSLPWRYWPGVAALGGIGTGIAIFVALGSSSPLSVTVTNVRTTGQLATIERITVSVHNRTAHVLKPSFTVENGGVITAFWSVLGSHPSIGPGRSASLTLLSPNFGAQPPVTGGFSVAAFTGGPDSVSTSNVFLPTTWHVALLPQAVPNDVPIGMRLTVRAELLDQLDQRVKVSQIPIYLGQIIYDQHGLIFSSAVVNGSSPGQTPVEAVTDKNGVATFVIQGTHATGNPVYFEANLVNFTRFYPYGYSNIVFVRFGNSS
jgi:hypothetical protein